MGEDSVMLRCRHCGARLAGIFAAAMLCISGCSQLGQPLSPDDFKPVELTSPSAGARFWTTERIGFDWSDVPNESLYSLQIARDSVFTNSSVTDSSTSSEFELVGGTLSGDQYFWRVRPRTTVGLGAWSVARPLLVVPREIAQYATPGTAEDIFVQGSYAYVADGGAGLSVLDVSDPAKLAEVGSCVTPNYAEHVFVSGQYAYVADQGAGLGVFSVSSPSAPHEVGRCDPGKEISAVAVCGGYAYLATDAGVAVVDVSTPVSPSFVMAVDTGLAYSAVQAEGQVLYAVRSAIPAGLVVYDITNPGSPTQIGVGDLSYYGGLDNLSVQGSKAYVGRDAGGDGVLIVDVSVPASPYLLGTITLQSWVQGVAADNMLLRVLTGGGVSVDDVSVPTQSREIGYASLAMSDARSMFCVQQNVFVANGSYGVTVLEADK